MNNSEQLLLPFAPTKSAIASRGWVGLQIDHRQFLDALQDEWLSPLPDQHGRLLAFTSFAEESKATSEQHSNLITVSLCFSLHLLPRRNIPVLVDGVWHEATVDSIPSETDFVFWLGAIPLFAVTRIIVRSAEERARLLGLIKQVSNVSMPDATIDIDTVSVRDHRGSEMPKDEATGISFARDYGLVRGAMTMAVWAVPRVDPWFDLLVASLSADKSRLKSAADATTTFWYEVAPWLPGHADLPCDTLDCRLWQAALRAFLEVHHEGAPGATAVVERIHEYAVGTSKSTDPSADKWRKQTLMALSGKESLRLDDWKQCAVGKAVQLLLLRPQPENFAKWLQDLPGIPPSVWLTAATLCGYLLGYRRLPTSFRGGAIQRRTLAAQALNVSSDNQNRLVWPFPDITELSWRRDQQDIVLMCGEFELVRKTPHPRTLWYIADLDDQAVRKTAEDLVRRSGWQCFTRRLKVSNSSISFSLSGPNDELSKEKQGLVVKGTVEFDLPEAAIITEAFDRKAFQRCLVIEGALSIQPPPVKREPVHDKDNRNRQTMHPAISGLLQVENFITPAEEEELIARIDAAEWLEELKRRVQHYGWRYDYKARRINTEMRLGPLPSWAAHLAERLTEDGLLPHVPDQVIVNEYKGKQGISKHIDCKPCFEDGIAMISLLESWEMNFSRDREKRQHVLLPRRSVTILTGEARHEWAHEIPKRAIEPDGLHRKRRVSITFRKVIVDTGAGHLPRASRKRPDETST
ncbi:MAG TPA: alpha-ketoglutarate-dependent dioxygenase AlkB [Gemmataceae bacterium]|nr:alpha-ketoglutarate-dependent dioxygenase AlkB [Gemmataceae bacterium]